MINESSGAATKNTQSVDERHEVYEEQRGCYEGHAERGRKTTLLYEGLLCCTKSSRAATKMIND